MIPHHSNPSSRKAHAPYNFVPLPEQVIRVDYEIPNHERYADCTGYLDCILTTLTPTYTRAAQNPEFFARWNDDKLGMMRDNQARETYSKFFSLDDAQKPIIPGSSLRGMTRALIEIAGYGKMDWVSNDPKITFRAVAAPRDDPLKYPYDKVLGKSGREVRAGYLFKKNDDWFVKPALLPRDYDGKWPGQDAYLKVRDRQISATTIPGFKSFNDPNYKPQYHEVSFDAKIGFRKSGNYVAITNIGSIASAYRYNGILICSGNMLETGVAGQLSPRTHHAIVLSPDPNAKQIKIRRQSVDDYLKGLTPFQKESPFDSQMGCLLDGHPIFYVQKGGEVVAFGHSPNFRIPYWLDDSMQATAPLDLVPKSLRSQVDKKDKGIIRIIDIAEAIFGFASESKKANGRAGRIFFTDAICESNQANIWLQENIVTPKILGGPKPTTFQHYLVQDRLKKHDPDDRSKLAHYGTPTPEETVIRGHKLYWHKRDGLCAEDFCENEEPNWKFDTQHTQIRPVSAGKRFSFRIYFENLTQMELGALLWVLDLPQGYHHKIGLGKSLGLGSVAIESVLVITNRVERYSKLFNKNLWHTGEDAEVSKEKFKHDFENYVMNHINQEERGSAQVIAQLSRIQMLLKMLEWPGPEPNLTNYMTIEPNQYKERPVLPDPLNVGSHCLTTSSPKTNISGMATISKSISFSSPPKSAGLTWLENTAKDLKINLDELLKKRPKDLPKRWMEIQEPKLKSDVLREIAVLLKAKGIWNNQPTEKLEEMVEFFKTQIEVPGM